MRHLSLKRLTQILPLIFLLILVNQQLIYSQKKVSYDGYFEIGGESKYREIYVTSFYKVKLEYKIMLKDWIKIQIDVRGDSEDRQIELHESKVEFKLNPNLELEVGDLKKRYGLEEQVSNEKLITIDKSIINDYLEPLGFVSRDPGFQLRWCDDGGMYSITGGAHYNETHRVTLMTRITKKQVLGLDRVGLCFQYAFERDTQLKNAYVAGMDALHDFGIIKTEFEVLTGQDPLESYYRKLDGESDMVNFLGARLQVSKQIFIGSNDEFSIEPLLQTNFLAKDIEQIDINSIGILAGCNFYFDEDVRLMFNGNLVLTNHFYDKDERTMKGSTVIGQLQVRW